MKSIKIKLQLQNKDKELKLLNIFSQLELVSQKYLEIQHRY